MVKSKHNRTLFNASGCLTLDAINRYHSERLSSKELEEVREHMEECEMCSDAVEGYKNLTDQKRQHQLIYTLRKNIRSRYTPRPVKVKYGRERRLNPTLTLISAAATILIILGIYGIVNTDIFRNENLLAEQIQEEEMKAEDKIIRAEEPASDAQTETTPILSKQPDSLLVPPDNQEPEIPEKTTEITAARKISEKVTPEMDVSLARAAEGKILYEPMDTLAIDQVGKIAGVTVEKESVAERAASKKTVALPVEAVAAEMDDEIRMEREDTGAIAAGGLFYSLVDEMPKFSVNGYQDFNDYIRKNLKYPENAKQLGMNREVLIQFIVNKNGKVEDVKVIQMVDSLLDKEAIRVVKSSPEWKPGMENGEKVNVQLVYPVIFE